MPRVAPVLLCLLVLAGCGGGGGGGQPDRLTLTTPKTAPMATPTATPDDTTAIGGSGRAGASGPVTAREKAVVRGWSDALRRGDVARAARYWTVPALVANGGQPLRLLDRSAVRTWNSTLPCGAKLEKVERDARYVLATFVLTERPGAGSCGTGVGHRARTLFLLSHGKIVQWLRATDPPPAGSTGDQS